MKKKIILKKVRNIDLLVEINMISEIQISSIYAERQGSAAADGRIENH